jgi:hypothetical protein
MHKFKRNENVLMKTFMCELFIVYTTTTSLSSIHLAKNYKQKRSKKDWKFTKHAKEIRATNMAVRSSPSQLPEKCTPSKKNKELLESAQQLGIVGATSLVRA